MVKDPVVGCEYWMVDGRLFETRRRAEACSARIEQNDSWRYIERVVCEGPGKFRLLETFEPAPRTREWFTPEDIEAYRRRRDKE